MKNKKVFIVFSIIITLILTFATLFQCPICTLKDSNYNNYSTFLRDSIKANPSLKETPLTELSLLGSHDALSNDINFGSKPNTSEDNIVNNGFVRTLTKGAMVRLSKAQKDDVYAQLNAGVRYLDVRICLVDGVYYNSHGLISNTLETNLLKIMKFLDENPGEFILFHLHTYYLLDTSLDDLKKYMDEIKYKDKNIFDYINYAKSISEFKDLNYSNITNGGSSSGVVIFTHRDNSTYPFNQFNSEHINSVWHDEMDSNTLINKIINQAKIGKKLGNSYLRINQSQQTPNANQWYYLFPNWSLLHQAKDHNLRLATNENIEEILDGLPIYMCDWSTQNSNNFNDLIISSLLKRNKSLNTNIA